MKNSKTKKILSILLAVIMLVGMIPATSLPAFAAAGGVVYVGGATMFDGDYLAVGATKTQTTQPSGGYAYYYDGTLTLNNYSYEGQGYVYGKEGCYFAIVYAEHDLTLKLVGTNTLTQTEENSNVIYVWNGDLTVDGNGKLICTADSYGLFAYGDLTINGGTIAVTTNYASIISFGNVSINGGDIIAETKLQNSPCINADYDVTIKCANVTAIGGTRAIAYGRSVTIAKDLNIRASTTADGALGEYTAANHSNYKKIVITLKSGVVYNVNVSATFSGTPAKATTSTTGATVTATKWYKQNGSSWTELTSSNTISAGNIRCEVTVGATGTYTLADGYTVKINGTAATKKSGNTWYRDVTITGYTSYVDVQDIALPEAFINPDFTYNDEEGAAYHWDVVQVEWFECDKDGHILSGALTENDVFQKDTYYRIEVTVVPETNWQFHGSDLSFYINGKAANYLYHYNKAYTDSVTGYVVYNTADIEGNYELYVYNGGKDIYIKDGQYLGSNATGATATKPASGGYAYYKDGVLELNGYDNEKAHFIFEELALELYLIGDNTIGAIYDNEFGMAGGNLETRQGNLVIDAADGGKLTIASNPLDAYANIQVKDLYFNGGELTSCLANGTYGAAVQLNGGNLYLENGYVAYVSDTNDFASATKWDGVTDLSTYDCVWVCSAPAVVVRLYTMHLNGTGYKQVGDYYYVDIVDNVMPSLDKNSNEYQVPVEVGPLYVPGGGNLLGKPVPGSYYNFTITLTPETHEQYKISSTSYRYNLSLFDDVSIKSAKVKDDGSYVVTFSTKYVGPNIYVGGFSMFDGDYLAVGATATQTTKPSGGYAYYKNGKLTLNNYSYEGKGYLNSGYYAVIYSKNDLTLELIGNNTLTQTASSASDMIYVDGAKLTIGGGGKLTGTAGGYALYADKDITINGGTVKGSADYVCIYSNGEVIINDGDITAESKNRSAIYSKYDVTVNGGNVTAIGGGNRAISCDSFSVAEGLKIQASTTADGEPGEYVAAKHNSYKKIVVYAGAIVSGTVTSFNSDTDEITIELWNADNTQLMYSTTETGKNPTYSIPVTEYGTYNMVVTTTGHVPYYKTIDLNAESTVQDVELQLYADTNLDGVIDVEDYQALINAVLADDHEQIETEEYDDLIHYDLVMDGYLDVLDAAVMALVVNGHRTIDEVYDIKKGDYDYDGEAYTENDLIAMYHVLSDIDSSAPTLSTSQKFASDLNYNGKVDEGDLAILTGRYGTIEATTCEENIKVYYRWGNSYTTCTATAICTICDKHVAKETVNSVKNADGSYTATFKNSLLGTKTYKKQ